MSAPKAEAAGLTVERREQIAAEHAPATTNLSWCSVDQQDWPCETRLLLDALAAAEAERDEARAAVERVRAWHIMARAKVRMGISCDCHAEITEALNAASTPVVCDHPGIDHDQPWSYCWPCPECGVCKFIGHGPLCMDCFTAPTADTASSEGA